MVAGGWVSGGSGSVLGVMCGPVADSDRSGCGGGVVVGCQG